MTDALPEDVNLWPSSPWELLGVKPGIAPRELRQAYARLIRKFKPEFFPDEYRRIRAAYDRLRDSMPHSGGSVLDPTHQDPLQAQSASGSRQGAPLEDPRPLPERSVPNVRVRAVTAIELWDHACQGDTQRAYRQLRQLAREGRGGNRAFAMLYWLLRAYPELDRRRDAVHWLEEGLERTGFRGMLASLFEREVEWGSSVALDSSWIGRVVASDDSHQAILLAQKRCRAAVRLGRWDLLQADLSAMPQRLTRSVPEQWFRFLLAMLDCLAWHEDPEAKAMFRKCWDQVQELSEWHLHFAEPLFRYDHYLALSSAVAAMQGQEDHLRAAMCELVRAGWQQSREKIAHCVEEFAHLVVQKPHAALRQFDQIKGIKACNVSRDADGKEAPTGRVLLQYLHNLLDNGCQWVNESSEREVLEFLDDVGLCEYATMREQLLAFCLKEALPPREVLSVLQANPDCDFDGTAASIVESLEEDSSLFLVCQVFDSVGAVWRG